MGLSLFFGGIKIMRITQWGEYGVLISVYLADKQSQAENEVVGASEIAHAQGIALQYAQQILLRLRDGGIVESVRGPHGGYRLAKPAQEVSLLHILLAAEGDTFELMCQARPISPLRCLEANPCFLRDIWKNLKTTIDSYLSSLTLDKIVEQSSPALLP